MLAGAGAASAASGGGGELAAATLTAPDLTPDHEAQPTTQTADLARLNEGRKTAIASRSESREQARLAEIKRQAERKKKEAAAKKKAEATKKRTLAQNQQDPRALAKSLLPEYGFGPDQWTCLDNLWVGESNWTYNAENPSSGAYGIPQSLPGSKMGTIADDWRENPETQIRWGLKYIKDVYNSPCGAWGAWQSRSPHWY